MAHEIGSVYLWFPVDDPGVWYAARACRVYQLSNAFDTIFDGGSSSKIVSGNVLLACSLACSSPLCLYYYMLLSVNPGKFEGLLFWLHKLRLQSLPIGRLSSRAQSPLVHGSLPRIWHQNLDEWLTADCKRLPFFWEHFQYEVALHCHPILLEKDLADDDDSSKLRLLP